MNCRMAESLLSSLVDGELGGRQMMEVRMHVARCPACREEYDAILTLKEALGATPELEPPAGFERRLREAVFGGEIATVRPHWIAQYGRPVLVGVTFAAALFAFLQFSRLSSAPAAQASADRTLDVEQDQLSIAAQSPFSGSAPIMVVSSDGR